MMAVEQRGRKLGDGHSGGGAAGAAAPRVAAMDVTDAGIVAAVEAIFFAASATQSFASAAARADFRERWLGRYLAHDASDALVALDGPDAVVGYLVGARDDPAVAPRFADIGYFRHLADLTAAYPAHLHVNLAAEARGQGVGARLVAAFCDRLSAAGIAGVHIVTGAGARNVGFYDRQGFRALRALDWGGRPIVVMGRRLAP